MGTLGSELAEVLVIATQGGADLRDERERRDGRDWLDGEGSIFPELRVAQFSPVSLVSPAICGINGTYAYVSNRHRADESDGR